MDYLANLRWPNGFVCQMWFQRSMANKAWSVALSPMRGSKSVTAGTIFHRTHKPLRLWFRVMWHITTQKYGANALGLTRVLEPGCYETSWQWLHKLRRAMVRPGRDRLCGCVQVDETYVGGRKSGKRGRGAEGKALVAIGVEDKTPKGMGRIRLQHLRDASEKASEDLSKP